MVKIKATNRILELEVIKMAEAEAINKIQKIDPINKILRIEIINKILEINRILEIEAILKKLLYLLPLENKVVHLQD